MTAPPNLNNTMTTTSADVAVIDLDSSTPEEKAAPLIQLCLFQTPRTPAELMRRTADYAENPIGYLNRTLGPSVVERRRSLLSIPKNLPVDRDTYGFGTHKEDFEKHIASFFNKSHGLFFISGTQAQSVAAKIYCSTSNNPTVAWHSTAHLESCERSAYSKLFGLNRILLGSNPNSLPIVSDVESLTNLPSDKRPAMLLLELPNSTLGCQTYTLEELSQISQLCRQAGIALHCDGARIWEIDSYYQAMEGVAFGKISELFDSIYVSFYKGLGGISGAMLLSNDTEFMVAARMWQRRAGGSPHSLMYEIIDAERAFNETIGTMAGKRKKMLEVATEIRKATERFQKDGRPIVSFVPHMPTCCQVGMRFFGYTANEFYAARDRVQKKTGVQVFTKFWGKSTPDQMMMEKWSSGLGKAKEESSGEVEEQPEEREHNLSWMIVSETQTIDTSVFVDSWTSLCEELVGSSSS